MNRLDLLRVVFGFVLLAIIAGLTAAVALGRVEEKTSYGLTPLLIILSTLGQEFARWAFKSRDDRDDKKDPDK